VFDASDQAFNHIEWPTGSKADNIDGDHNGTPGGNAISILSKDGAVVQAATAARAKTRTQVRAAVVIDALVVRGELAEIRAARRNER
jgi:hypothetical protein